MLSRREIYWHLAGWLFLISLFVIPFTVYGLSQKILYSLLVVVFNIPIFYFSLLWAVPRWIRNRNLLFLALVSVLLILIYTTASMASAWLLSKPSPLPLSLRWINAFVRTAIVFFVFFFPGAAYYFIRDWYYREKIKKELENRNLKSELSFLKAQVNPHFFLNTLNNIYILAYKGSDKTADAIMQLSDIMKYLLYDTTSSSVHLQKEVDCIGRIIALQQLRTKEKPALKFCVKGDIENYHIAPALLIPFVENIFKHGNLSDSSCPAQISVSAENNRISFHSVNKIQRLRKESQSGIGISNTRRRLELIYPQKHKLIIHSTSDSFEVKLQIKVEHV